jgi:signal transduction histidine kinase
MGQLAAQVAHKMKNLPSGIKILAQGLRRECGAGTPEAEFVDEILAEVSSAESYIYEQLNASSTAAEDEPASMSELLAEVVEQCAARAADAGVAVELDVAPDLPRLSLNRKYIAGALRGVLLNALEASASGGRVHVRARCEEGAGTPADPTILGQMVVEVQDQGAGIAPEHLGRIFDPFYTTKPGAEGVGLWLFHRAIESLKGKVQVESQPGQGTTMRAMLPVPSESRWERLLQTPNGEQSEK